MDMVIEKKRIKGIVVQRVGQIVYLYFNFNRGVMNTHQCFVLKQAIAQIKTTDAKMIVLMGGEEHWFDGINTHNVKLAPNPAVEQQQNIGALDDLVQELMDTPNQITVAAVRHNIGAGALSLLMACDKVFMCQSAAFNPTNQNIDLYNKPSWRFCLNKKLGKYCAFQMLDKNQPFLAHELVKLNLVDKLSAVDWESYHATLFEFCEQLVDNVGFVGFLERKVALFNRPYWPMSAYKARESVYVHDTAEQADYQQSGFVYIQPTIEHKPPTVVSL